MVPDELHAYLRQHGVAYRVRQHPFAIDSAHLAAAQHVSGWQLAKPVIVSVNGTRVMVVLRGPDRVDLQRLSAALGGRPVELCSEGEFPRLFPECELGAEPPLGGLFGLPVYIDQALASLAPGASLLLRAGSHTDCVELSLKDFLRLENPRVIDVSRPSQPPPGRQAVELTAHAEMDDDDDDDLLEPNPYHEEGAPVG